MTGLRMAADDLGREPDGRCGVIFLNCEVLSSASRMPTLTRFALACVLTLGAVYCAALALARLVEPTQRQIVETIPQERIERPASRVDARLVGRDSGAGLESASTNRLARAIESFGFAR